MNTQKRDFDSAAAAWDENPNRVKLAKDVAATIQKEVEITSAMRVADFGCGTGLLSFLLRPLVDSVTGIDSSRGMLDVFRNKIDQLQLTNMETQLVDFDRGDVLAGSYDLVVSNMTLHHIKEISTILSRLHAVLVPGGTLCITDLDLDGGRFHDDNTGVFHNGFDRQELQTAFAAAGFANIRDTTAAEIMKPGADGEKRTFTVFLMTGRRK